VGEEWGVLGALGLLLALLVLVARGLRAAMRAAIQADAPGAAPGTAPIAHGQSSFVSLLAVGLSAMLGWQTLIIVGGALKLIPLTGITLPFVSYGGSSMLVSCLMVGLLVRASGGGTPQKGGQAG
jgi:cell division protein FtsW (lipid II flippase)